MKVELISTTKVIRPLKASQEQEPTMGEYLAHVARVSNPGNQMNHETAPKLLRYCLTNGHWSVFESGHLVMEIETSRAISQQIIRHRSFTFQEFSLRYAAAAELEPYEARRQDKKDRQNSIDDMGEEDKTWFREAQDKNWELAFGLYNEAIRRGVALECARILLPLGIKTTIFVVGNVRSWIHYTIQRGQKGVQKEHRVIARECLRILIEQVPELWPYMCEKIDWLENCRLIPRPAMYREAAGPGSSPQ